VYQAELLFLHRHVGMCLKKLRVPSVSHGNDFVDVLEVGMRVPLPDDIVIGKILIMVPLKDIRCCCMVRRDNTGGRLFVCLGYGIHGLGHQGA
jgi:hypothetical protein